MEHTAIRKIKTKSLSEKYFSQVLVLIESFASLEDLTNAFSDAEMGEPQLDSVEDSSSATSADTVNIRNFFGACAFKKFSFAIVALTMVFHYLYL